MSELTKTLPTGHVTLMFTDIVDSTPFWKRYPEAFEAALEHHNTLILDALPTFDGHKVSMTGDGLMLAFSEPEAAARCAAHLQECFGRETWPMLDADDRVAIRIGIHSGDPRFRHDSYFGLPVSRARRICDAGHGGQILLSEDTCRELNAVVPGAFLLCDLGLYRLKGLDSPEHLFQLVTETGPERFPPLRATALSLPLERNDFIGHAKILAEIENLLADPNNRLITITGMGGMGKTRTALRLAHHLTPHALFGVYFAELTSLTETSSVLPYLLDVFCLTCAPDASPLEAISDFLHEQNTVLILDNLEQLEEIETVVYHLLDRCPTLRILATSRIALSLWMQREVSLPPLPVPVLDASFAQIAEAESVRLFVRRAQNIQREFQLTPQNASSVAEICRIVAGIPLGIELAVQKIRFYAPDAIAARLWHQLLDVMGRTPELLQRQWSLRAVFEWSDKLLSSSPRALLARLLVFRGSFCLDAVESVCADESVEDVDSQLEHLLNHSWLERVQGEEGQRFRLLEPIAEYVRDTYGPPSEALCLAHARYFQAQAQQMERLLRSGSIMTAVTQLRSDLGNLRAVMRWACNVEAHDLVSAMGASLGVVMTEAGLWDECTAWVGLAVRSATVMEDHPQLSQLATLQGIIAERRGLLQVAYDYQAQALHHAAIAGNNRGVMRAHINLANLARTANDLPTCVRHAQEILRYAPLCDMHADMGLGYIYLAAIAEQEFRNEEAETLWQQARAGFEKENDVRSLAHWTSERGQAKEKIGALDAAMRYYKDAVVMWYSLGHEQRVTVALAHLSRIALRKENYPASALFIQCAKRLSNNHSGELQILKEVTQMLRERVGTERMQQMLHEGQTYSVEDIITDFEMEAARLLADAEQTANHADSSLRA